MVRLTKYHVMTLGNVQSRTADTGSSVSAPSVKMREPSSEDGPSIHALIARCPPLDPNSLYCNLLQTSHFASTCVVAESNGKIVGWVSGYIQPDAPDRYFLWQVAVDASMRGQKLAQRMIRNLLERERLKDVHYVNTTITPDNAASWRLFRGVAEDLGGAFSDSPHFLEDTHFAGQHQTENMVTIGPFTSARDGR